MSQNSTNDNNRFTRFPEIRTFIEDLNQGNWNFEENILESRYGKVKRVKMCGVVLNKKEVIEEEQEESFLMDDEGPKSRISFEIDDGTDRLWATIWNVNIDEYKYIKPGVNVDLVGIVRIYNNRIQVTLDYIRELKNPNFESYHRIDVIRKRKLEPQHEIPKNDQMGSTDFDFDMPDEDFGFLEEEIKEDSAQDSLTANNEQHDAESQRVDQDEKVGLDEDMSDSTMSKLDAADQIQNYIKNHDKEDGVSKDELLEHFTITPKKLDEILEKLRQDIVIYKTQPNHYSSY